MDYIVYIAQTSSGRYYVGQTKRLAQRLREHGRLHGAAFLRGRETSIVYTEQCSTLKEARGREEQLKG